MAKPQYSMFIDDTGDVTPSTTNSRETKYASITGIVFERTYLEETFEPGFRTVVGRHFGTDANGKPPVLHRRQMISPSRNSPFVVLKDTVKRSAWDRSCINMMTRANYTAITVCLDKVAFYYHHPKAQLDVYEILIQNAVERYFYFLRAHGAGDVVVEAQNKETDLAIKQRFRRVMESGTEHISADKLAEVFTSKEINVEPKKSGFPGLQLADLLARPAFAHCLGIYAKDTSFLTEFARQIAPVLENYKFYRDKNGNPDGYGRIWRPQKR
jgi:hypothetical protein